ALFASLPLSAVRLGRDVGSALTAPLNRIQSAMSWANANPVADAVGAANVAQIPLGDVAALHYALYPDAGFFTVTGTQLVLDSAKTDDCLDALVALATSKPAAPPARGG